MKILIIIIITTGIVLTSHAQIGINTTDPKATLDVSASNQVTPANTDGVLIPRVDSFSLTNPTADQNGMLVYLTTADGTNLPGIYYWDSANWIFLKTSTSHYVGELFGGGIVFYVYDNGNHGLIASLDDLDTNGTAWGLYGIDVPNCENINNGANNTQAIIAAGGLATDAAGLCNAYTGGGCTDWYLPAANELYLLIQKHLEINFVLDNDADPLTNGLNIAYWSSTEVDASNSYVFNAVLIGSYPGFSSYKNNVNISVRAIRCF